MEYNRIAVGIFNTNTSFEGIKFSNFDIFHCTQQAPHHYDFDFAAKKLQQNYFLDVLVEHCVLLRSKTYHPSVIVVRREFTQLRHCFLASLVLYIVHT